MNLPLDVEAIKEILPHRYPFLLIDRVTELDLEAKEVVAIKNVTINEGFFQGHFPNDPVMPGVLVVEAMAQAGGIMACLATGVHKTGMAFYFAGLDKVRFRQPVRPGDQLVLKTKALRAGAKVWKMGGQAFVDDTLVASAELMAAVHDSSEGR